MSAATRDIVRAESQHVDDVAELFDAYRRFYGQSSDLDGSRAFVNARIESQDSVILLAYDGRVERPGAAGFTQLYPSFSSVAMTRIWILNDLFVAEDARRLGIGRSLMIAAHAHARRTGAIRVELATQVSNEQAKRLYEELGYRKDTAFDRYSLRLEGQL